uniref:Uncharacterized protein n=1 Tax=Anopheles triannulatus TaxID=58253 RepID=A0A2M4ASP6_9DIPT
MAACGVCALPVTGDAVLCSGWRRGVPCNKRFHAECFILGKQCARKILSTRSLMWFCDDCLQVFLAPSWSPPSEIACLLDEKLAGLVDEIEHRLSHVPLPGGKSGASPQSAGKVGKTTEHCSPPSTTAARSTRAQPQKSVRSTTAPHSMGPTPCVGLAASSGSLSVGSSTNAGSNNAANNASNATTIATNDATNIAASSAASGAATYTTERTSPPSSTAVRSTCAQPQKSVWSTTAPHTTAPTVTSPRGGSSKSSNCAVAATTSPAPSSEVGALQFGSGTLPAGSGIEDCLAVRRCWLYLSGFKPSCSDVVVAGFVKSRLSSEDVVVRRLTKAGTNTIGLSFVSFKVGLPLHLRGIALSSATWPSALRFGEFVNRPAAKANRPRLSSSDDPLLAPQSVDTASSQQPSVELNGPSA